MNVTLVSYTPDALNLLLATKGTRLAHKSDPAHWTPEQREEHLSYMKDTIKSSWEFVDYVFNIEGVTRAFTHQLVRTRTGSYAQEAMRVVDARTHEVVRPQFKRPESEEIWCLAVEGALNTYGALLDGGEAAQDARGLLPTNITTSIMCKFNLRTLHEMAKLRLCTRTQGEYQDVFRRLRELVIGVHPWVAEHDFLEVQCVSNGTCAFPRYGRTECKAWHPDLQRGAAIERSRKAFWAIRQEASPVAKEGMAM